MKTFEGVWIKNKNKEKLLLVENITRGSRTSIVVSYLIKEKKSGFFLKDTPTDFSFKKFKKDIKLGVIKKVLSIDSYNKYKYSIGKRLYYLFIREATKYFQLNKSCIYYRDKQDSSFISKSKYYLNIIINDRIYVEISSVNFNTNWEWCDRLHDPETIGVPISNRRVKNILRLVLKNNKLI